MIITLCSSCRGEAPTGRIWTVCSWRLADGTRRAYKHRLCLVCTASKVVPVFEACRRPEMLCPNCGIDTTDDYDAVYGHFVPRKVGALTFEAPFCSPCAALYRIWFQEGAELLEDRSPAGEGPTSGPSPTAEQVLASLGIVDYGGGR